MASLDRTLRKDLETTVKKARRVAEAGARKAIEQLRVGDGDAPKDLTTEQRALRTKLRAHGRQLGDRRDAKTGIQETAHLVQECAYEHWHRMLFARFLGETDLLIEPESGVAVTLDEVQELAREKGTDWLPLASEYAERMLPQIFRKDDPVLDIALPPETRSELEDLLKALAKAAFEADDSLGWVYQFWQADKKEEVNKSEVKIGADELPAVTQLFTEDYMVLFLLHNTLGAWWAGKVLASNPALAESAASEDALRAACSVGDVDWAYLRFVRDKTNDGAEGLWRPATGMFDGWPKAAKDITLLDPCMGSGHFLVFALPILAAFRMAEEGLSERDAIDAVLHDNLFGLEIDPRCTQIAAFNLAFAAWRRVGHRPLPRLNLACSGLAIGVTKPEWLKLAEKAVTAVDPAAKRDLLGVEKNLLTVGLEERVKNGLVALYDLFAKAPWLGSLIDPRRAGADIFREGFDKLAPLLASILTATDTDDAREMVVAAQGMATAAEYLSRQFCLVVTNVPYLGRGRQDEILRDYLDRFYKTSRADLATSFIERAVAFTRSAGTAALVTPQNWLFLGPYKSLRRSLLENDRWDAIGRLGSGAFETISGEVVNVALFIVSSAKDERTHGIFGLDANNKRTIEEKALVLKSGAPLLADQRQQLINPDAMIRLDATSDAPGILGDYVQSCAGVCTGDYPRFGRSFWEMPSFSDKWSPQQTTNDRVGSSRGYSKALLWEGDNGSLRQYVTEKLGASAVGSWIRGKDAWGKEGVAVTLMQDLPTADYFGDLFDDNVAVLIPRNPSDLAAIRAFCSSDEFAKEVRKFNQKLAVKTQYLVKVPFDIDRWRPEENEGDRPAPHDPTQWLFDGQPVGSEFPLHVALARLAAYFWPRNSGHSFPHFPALPSDSLGAHADPDGIVCLTALKGEPPAEQRLNALLADAFGVDWSAAKLSGLLAAANYVGKSLDDWLRDGFFAQHCELFQQRPFIWHISDGRRDGFHALVNYHRLAAPKGEGRRTLEKLIYSYLGDWIDRQRGEQKVGVEGADARLAHAEHLRAELIKILEGEPPYDIFVRWKPLHEQPLGWDPDINDGVRMNIRPFMTARTLNARAANTCILRSSPRIKWDKDRGKEPIRDKIDYPWFWGWDESSGDFAGGAEFDGNRWNDLHYSRAAKQSARDRRGRP